MSDILTEAVARAIHDHACNGEGGCSWLGEDGADQACDLEQTAGFAEAAIAVVRERIATDIEDGISVVVAGAFAIPNPVAVRERAARIARGEWP